MFPVAVLVGGLGGRRHIGEARGLRYVFRFGVVPAGGLVLDGHPEVVAHGLVSGSRNADPFLLGRRGAGLGRDVGEVRPHGADFLVVLAGIADAANLHIHQQLVPRVV